MFVTKSNLRNAAILYAAKIFARWVLHGKTYDLKHDQDPSWDCSGRLIESFSDFSTRLAKYKTLGEWMEDCYVGTSTASHQSGCGLYWDTFSEEIQDAIQRLAESVLMDERGLNKEDLDVGELVTDDAMELWGEALEVVEKIDTAFAWEISHVE